MNKISEKRLFSFPVSPKLLTFFISNVFNWTTHGKHIPKLFRISLKIVSSICSIGNSMRRNNGYVKFSSRKWRRSKFNFWRWLPVVAHVPAILSDCTSLRQWLNYGGRKRVDRKAVWSPSQMVGGYWRWKHRKNSHPKTASMKLSLSIFLRSGCLLGFPNCRLIISYLE